MSSYTGRVVQLALQIGASLVLAVPAGAQTSPATITVPRLPRAPALEYFAGQDGHATDSSLAAERAAAWLGVAVSDFRQREPGDGTPVSQATTAYLSYDDANLYVVFVCRDDPTKVRGSVARREEIAADDQVVLYLDTFRDRERAYFFMANPLGVQLDGVRTEGQDDDLSWDAVWQSDGRLTQDGYVVRMTIPFRSLRFPRAPVQSWGVALGRVIRRGNEEAYWPFITKRVKGFVAQFTELQGLESISPPRNVQVNPYGTLARARVLDKDAAALVTEGDQRGGLDAKIVLRDALTLDGTVNPDFSQVETDDPQVTINQRFEVFFPEKRPFFIENAGYFQTPVNLFFSRRIVDPGGGVRLTGKAGRWSLGAIAINDREPGRVPAPDPLAGSRASVGAFRVQHELGDESTIGALVTDRELEGNYARVVSLDTRLKLGHTWAATGQVMRSDIREDTTASAGSGVLIDLERDGRNLDYSGTFLALDPTFAAPVGFVERTGIRQTEHKWKYRVRPRGAAVLSYGPEVKIFYVWAPDGRQLDREFKAQFLVELVGQTELSVKRTELFERFENAPFRPYKTEASLSTEWLKWLALAATYGWGGDVNHDPASGLAPFLGRATEADLQLTVRPTPGLRVDQAAIESRLDTWSGARVFTERQFRTKVTYQFSRCLSLRAIVDYKAAFGDTTLADIEDKRKWGADLLLTYLVNPGTAFYVGYTDRYENLAIGPGSPPSLFRSRSPDMSVGRQVFVKLSYLWRF
ncbi:MAG TPA: DUF5916 domain-containing protein [Gemmatimonadales bacterium]|nr:DUF5916 domain-containing protein [Gemmatimonadales bacterium]